MVWPAMTAKLFLPVVLAVLVGIIAVPIDSVWRAAWTFAVAMPMAGLAIWLFITIGELRLTDDGVRYRKWIRWRIVPVSGTSERDSGVPLFRSRDSA